MIRENRYFVLKKTDMKCLNREEKWMLKQIANKVHRNRLLNKKGPLVAAVVEGDWPEWDMVWASVAKRVDHEEALKKINID